MYEFWHPTSDGAEIDRGSESRDEGEMTSLFAEKDEIITLLLLLDTDAVVTGTAGGVCRGYLAVGGTLLGAVALLLLLLPHKSHQFFLLPFFIGLLLLIVCCCGIGSPWYIFNTNYVIHVIITSYCNNK